jgi:hypothetical protein
MLFPWLYPSANSDFNESRTIDIGIKDWSRQQLFMADGRFSKDKMCCLHALNYAECRRNMAQGQWFVNNFLHSEEIPCIDALKEKLKNNDTQFIEKLQHFAQCVPGSDSYWRNKRAELISWTGHRKKQGNGAPSLFVTFSCAEYHWKDIEKLLNDRRKIAVDPPVSLKSVTEKVRAVNDYSIIIQKYFQVRVSDFIENNSKEVFGIHNYYARFEFAKSQGQIHVHILAMLGKKSSIIELNDLVYKERHDVKKQARVADDWMMNVFGLTAIHPGSSTGGVLDRKNIGKREGTCKTPLCRPASQKLLKVTDYKLHLCTLCNCCQMHNCKGYYLYHKNAYQEIRGYTIRLIKKGNRCMKFNSLHQPQNHTKNMM